MVAACLLLPTTASADIHDTSAAYWRLNDTGVGPELVGNGGFESSAAGHDASAGYFTSPATSVTRDSSIAHSGAASGLVTVPGWAAYEGEHYRITQSFRQGVKYAFSVWVRSASATNNVNVALGTGSDNAGASNGPIALSGTWQKLTGTWTPTADRSSADVGVYLPGEAGSSKTFHLDDLSVYERRVSATDSKGSNDGTYTGGYTLNVSGATPDGDKAVLLDGANGRITTSYNPFSAGSARTFEGWAKRKTNASDDALFAGDAAIGYPVLRAKAGGNDVRFNPNTTGAGQDFANALPGTGVWFHWALVWDGTSRQATLYVNGVSKGTLTFVFPFSGSPGNLELGAEGGAVNPFDGHLDDVAVYTRALSASEVAQLAYPHTGTTYFVSPTGSDSNAGTSPANAWRTVAKVNSAALNPGDAVMFEGGSPFSDTYLGPSRSGTASSPIVYGSYGSGKASLPKGIYLDSVNGLTFENLSISGASHAIAATPTGVGTRDISIEGMTLSNATIGINSAHPNSANWTIRNSTISNTTDSGMILEGSNYSVTGNQITDTGTVDAPFNKHGIYLKVSGATVSGNTILRFRDNGVSVRKRNSVVDNNVISGGGDSDSFIAIAWFQEDSTAGTSRWRDNRISGTTSAGIYVSREDAAGPTKESFVITGNTITPAAGVCTDLQPTSGTYTLQPPPNTCNGGV
jgi:hypothetical protein